MSGLSGDNPVSISRSLNPPAYFSNEVVENDGPMILHNFGQDSNIDAETEIRVFGKYIETKEEQLRNTPSLRVVTAGGMVTEAKEEQLQNT